MRTPLTLAAALLSLAWSSLASATPVQVPVTTCGQAVPRRAIGYLIGDLDCTGYDGDIGAVRLERSATLELRGFTITGGLFNVFCFQKKLEGSIAIYSPGGSCRIVGGGGTLTDAEAHGVTGNSVIMSDLTIQNAGQAGIFTRRKGTLVNVTIVGSGANGARLDTSAKVTGSTISSSGANGIFSPSLRLVDSTVGGNGVGPECGATGCVDLMIGHLPRLKNSTCGTSRSAAQNGTTWGVCQLD